MSDLKVRSIILLFGQMTINSCRLFTIKEMSLPLCITIVSMPRNANLATRNDVKTNVIFSIKY